MGSRIFSIGVTVLCRRTTFGPGIGLGKCSTMFLDCVSDKALSPLVSTHDVGLPPELLMSEGIILGSKFTYRMKGSIAIENSICDKRNTLNSA